MSHMFNKRNRTPSEHIGHGLCLYFPGLSTRNVAKALSFLHIVRRSHVGIWKWIQKYCPKRMSSKRNRISEFIVDETAIKAGSGYLWLWVSIEPKNMQILALSISKERNMFVAAERFIAGLARTHGRHPVSTDGGTWYPQACRFLKLIAISIPLWRKALSKGECSTSGKGSSALMTTFPAKRKDVT
jgi:putative transposase